MEIQSNLDSGSLLDLDANVQVDIPRCSLASDPLPQQDLIALVLASEVERLLAFGGARFPSLRTPGL